MKKRTTITIEVWRGALIRRRTIRNDRCPRCGGSTEVLVKEVQLEAACEEICAVGKSNAPESIDTAIAIECPASAKQSLGDG